MDGQVPTRPRTIVVGVADPTISQAPLQWAVEQARAFGKTLLAVTARPAPETELWPRPAQPDRGDQQEAQALLDEAIERLRGARSGIELRREVRQGTAVQVLVHASRDADLLVLGGRRARGRFDQRPMSVAAQCIQLAACPVVVVPVARPSPRDRGEAIAP